MCSSKEYIRYVFLFVCANGIIESQAKKQDKTYHVTVPGNFCQPCPGFIHFKPINKSCSQMKSDIASTVTDLTRYYGKSERLIKEALNKMLHLHATLPSDHPINISDFESDSKIKRMIRHRSLNEKEFPVHLAYSRISILASYLQLLLDIIDDIPYKKVAGSLNEILQGAIVNLRRSSCRHFSLVEILDLKSLSERVCKFKKRVPINGTTHRIQYVISVLKYGEEDMRDLTEGLRAFKSTMEKCEILPIIDKDLSNKSSSGDKKEPRSMTKSKERRKKRRRCRKLKKKNKRKNNKKKNSRKCRKGGRRNRNKSRKSKQ